MFLNMENEQEELIGVVENRWCIIKTKTASLGKGRKKHPVSLSVTSL